MESILEVKDLKKNYGDFAAVEGITFDVIEGETFSLLDPNGAGKTTTISMLSTLYMAGCSTVPRLGSATAIIGQSVLAGSEMFNQDFIGEFLHEDVS